MYYVYILESIRNNKKYVGYTTDLKQRIRDHNYGKSKFTRENKPWKLIYYEAFINKKDARREEAFLKTGKGRQRMKFLFDN